MKHTEGCGVCGAPLIYSSEDRVIKCNLCGKEAAARIYCPQGHYVCDACHSRGTQELLRKVLSESRSTSPIEALEQVMSNPGFPMHGPEHHILVPAVIVTAVRNAGYPVPENALEEALKRGSRVPGGWCGLFGDCGAAVGVGIAVSVLTRATPLTGKSRSLAMRATSEALRYICDDGPRCCKRSSRKALETAIRFLDEHLGFRLDKMNVITCNHIERNKECIREACPYFPAGKPHAD